jgi:O-antigen ligase
MGQGTSRLSLDRVAFVAVGIFILGITWNGLRIGGTSVATPMLVLAFLAVLALVVLGRRAVPLPPWLLAVAFGLVLAAMLNLIFPPDASLTNKTLLYFRSLPGRPLGFLVPRPDLLMLAQWLIALLIIPMMITAVANTKDRVKRLLDLFVISALISAGIGILDIAGLPVAPVPLAGSRTMGLTLHPNYLATVCTMAIPLALLWATRPGRWRPAGYMATLLLLVGAYASGSRAGAVAAVLAIPLTVIFIPQLRRRLGFLLPVVGIGLVALVVVAGDQILEQARLSGDVGTSLNTTMADLQRSKTADVALAQFQARPIQGVGFSVVADAHSIWLQLLASGGVIALVSFLVFLGGLGSTIKSSLGTHYQEIAIACGVAVFMWLVKGALDNQLADKHLYVIPGLMIATARLAVAERSSTATEPAAEPVRTAPPQPLRRPRVTPEPGSA